MLNLTYIVNFLRSTIRLGVPLCFPALGEGFLEQSGSLNIGLEGLMLVGAWGGVLGGYMTGSPWVGLGVGVFLGLIIAALEAAVCIYLQADEVVTGAAINLLGLGISSYTYRLVFGVGGEYFTVPGFKSYPIPVLSDLPLIGEVLFVQPIMFYLMILIAVALWFILTRTSWGLDIRAAGEDPWVTEAEGADVYRIRALNMVLGGMLAAAGGAFITLSNVHVWFDNLTAGRGFIALTIPVIGRWNPLGILGGAVLFGATEAFGLALQARLGANAPFQLLLMIPFVITMILFPWASAGRDAPAALGKGYRRAGES
jgi:ABC-type uncharacterized transport system permease subunit